MDYTNHMVDVLAITPEEIAEKLRGAGFRHVKTNSVVTQTGSIVTHASVHVPGVTVEAAQVMISTVLTGDSVKITRDPQNQQIHIHPIK